MARKVRKQRGVAAMSEDSNGLRRVKNEGERREKIVG